MALPPISEHRFVIIIGAGPSGILQAAELLRKNILPHNEFAILDRYKEFGGCWVQNTYPGCACDTWSHVYEVSWHRNPNWKRMYATQPELKTYYQTIASELSLSQSTHFSQEVVKATWLSDQLKWLLEVRDLRTPGAPPVFWTCNVMITALGPFTVPKKIDVPGVDDFAGDSWHAFAWPKDWEDRVKGKKVAVIGTGPSAAQFTSHLQKEAGELVVYQRNPGTVWSRGDYVFAEWRKALFRWFPWWMSLYAWWLLQWQEIFIYAMTQRDSFWQRYAHKKATDHCRNQVTDPEKREKLMPKDQFGCKRPMFLDSFYPALNAPNCSIITDPVVEITKTGIISRGGKSPDDNKPIETKVDVLVWGTGYNLDIPGAHFPIYGRSGKLLQTHYGKELYCLYGITIDEFPNMCNFLGPYSVGYWTPVIEQIELTAHYNGLMIAYLLEANKGSFARAVMLRREAAVEWTEGLREGQRKLVASMPSCTTYYRTKHGTILNPPFKMGVYRKVLRRFEVEDMYVVLERRAGVQGEEVVERKAPGRW